MKITLAQLNPKVGDFDGNLAKALNVLEQVAPESPDLIVMPELYLMGYPPQDLLEKKWFIRLQQEALSRLTAESEKMPDTGIIIGAAMPSQKESGRGLYNSALLINRGKVVFNQAKSLLPTYDVFDEDRYFDTASKIKALTFKGDTIGLCVCEDAWNDPDLWLQQKLYSLDPLANLSEQGASLIINISASPFHLGKDEIRYRLIRGHARRLKAAFVFVNQVGGNDELIFDGRSMCLDNKGEPIAILPAFKEEFRTVDLDRPGTSDLFIPQDGIESVYQALILGIRDYLGKSGFKSAVVGLSGGIDSAVTFSLAAAALGRDNVLGISMPSMYSSAGSVDDSRALAENLGAPFKIAPIKNVYDSYMTGLNEHFAGTEEDVTEENIQARIRGNILMAFSNKYNHLVLATGNKSELSMGYCTLYGDMCGGLSVLSDVPKVMVYELAEYINREKEIIPRATIEKAPSAELRPDQKDEDSLPPYPVLDEILQLYIEEGLSCSEITAKGFEAETVKWIAKTVNRNEYKRRQSAPGLKVTSKAFGVGRRMPVVANTDLG